MSIFDAVFPQPYTITIPFLRSPVRARLRGPRTGSSVRLPSRKVRHRRRIQKLQRLARKATKQARAA